MTNTFADASAFALAGAGLGSVFAAGGTIVCLVIFFIQLKRINGACKDIVEVMGSTTKAFATRKIQDTYLEQIAFKFHMNKADIIGPGAVKQNLDAAADSARNVSLATGRTPDQAYEDMSIGDRLPSHLDNENQQNKKEASPTDPQYQTLDNVKSNVFGDKNAEPGMKQWNANAKP
ncbi:MAG: hypothetical protein GY696_39665, partial [Gammaproteobacteria bacterium]|nr:hypothetical protein [Gammaproteobacteria bacterium]